MTITEVVAGRSYRVSASSFFQVNTPQAAELVRLAMAYRDLRGHETVLDAFCGVGLFGLLACQLLCCNTLCFGLFCSSLGCRNTFRFGLFSSQLGGGNAFGFGLFCSSLYCGNTFCFSFFGS